MIPNNNQIPLIKIDAKKLCELHPNTILTAIESSIVKAVDGYYLEVNVNNVCVADIQRHAQLLQKIATLFCTKLPAADKCKIVNAPHCFEQLFTLIRPFITDAALQKISVEYKKNNNTEYETVY